MSESVHALIAAHTRFIEREYAAEVEAIGNAQTRLAPSLLQQRGLALLNLSVHGTRTGLGGRCFIDFGNDPALSRSGDELAPHGFTSGDVVLIRGRERAAETKRSRGKADSKSDIKPTAGIEATIVRVKRSEITVVLARDDDDIASLGSPLWMVKVANEATFKRTNLFLRRLRDLDERHYSPLQRVLLGLESPGEPSDTQSPGWKAEGLNLSQQAAANFAIDSPYLALIHGPPGTGKTATLTQIILRLVELGKKVLVCGPSNTSVDNIVERLSSHGVPMVRLGHPARLLPTVLPYAMEVIQRTSEAGALVRDIDAEIDRTLAQVRKTRTAAERHALRNNVKDLRREARERELKCTAEILSTSRVVLSTLHGAGSRILDGTVFDVAIIDEASQAMEAQCWIPIQHARKLIMAGDHLQLPPTVKSVVDQREFHVTLFERMLKTHGDNIKRMLRVQYRMHDLICRYPSQALYGGQLVADESVAHRLLCDLDHVTDTADTREPLVYYDTQGDDFREGVQDLEDGMLSDSHRNEPEARLAVQHVDSLLRAGLTADSIAIITPYAAQVSLLKDLLTDSIYAGLEIGTVDGLQGREKEAVVLSLVRSNEAREMGFLSERRRMNVAMTRARRHLAVIGDSETVGAGKSGGPFFQGWINYLENNADLRYPDITEVYSVHNH